MSWVKQLGPAVRELRVVLCQSSERSEGARKFVQNNYWNVKNTNPQFPFIVRECEEIDPYVLIRYRFGIEKKALVSNLSESELNEVVGQLVQEASTINKTI